MKRAKRLLVAFGYLLALVGTVAAADMPVPYYKAPPPILPPPPLWTGFYVGINGGLGATNEDQNIFGVPSPKQEMKCERECPSTLSPVMDGRNFQGLGPLFVATGIVPSRIDTHGSGGVFGGQAGYNFQINPAFVIGAEVDAQWTDIRGQGSQLLTTVPLNTPFNASLSTIGSSQLNWYGTIRARAGYLATPGLLLFVTGGAAFGQIDDQISTALNVSIYSRQLINVAALASDDSTRWGWTAGAGFEYLVTPRVSLKGEYQFLDFGSRTNPFGTSIFNQPLLFTVDHKDQFNIVKLGVNYHFVP
jgi:outer membrane immunogenic protein